MYKLASKVNLKFHAGNRGNIYVHLFFLKKIYFPRVADTTIWRIKGEDEGFIRGNEITQRRRKITLGCRWCRGWTVCKNNRSCL